jgi:hypothetical protein
MIKVLGIGLSIALSLGVASAQTAAPTPATPTAPAAKKAPARKKPAKKPAKPDPKPVTQPDPPADPQPAATASTTPGPATLSKPDALAPIKVPSPAATPAAPAPSGKPGTASAPAHPAPMEKTTEKPGTQLDKRGGSGDYRVVTDVNERAASQAFREGNALLNDGLFVKAIERYNVALQRWDHPAIHYNIALALINLNQPIETYEQLNKALQYGAEPLEKDKYDHGKEYLRLVEGQLADVDVSCDKIGAKVSVDGKEVFVAPGKYTAKVRVGKHTFYADKQGYNARITAPFLGPGDKFRIELKLYTAEELTRYRRRWNATWLPYTVIGVGAVAGLVGAGLELSANSSFKDFDKQVADCNAMNAMMNGGCDVNKPGLKDLRDSGNSKRTAGFVMYGIAGGAVVAGAVLAYLNRSEPYQIRAEDLSQEKVSVTPVVAPGMAGASVQGHF